MNHQIPLFHAPAVQIRSMQKNSTKQKKLTKYNKKSQNFPKFEHGVLNNVGRPHKKNEAKKTKTKKFLPRVPSLALGEEALSRVPEQGTRGRACIPRVPGKALGEEFLFFFCFFLPHFFVRPSHII